MITEQPQEWVRLMLTSKKLENTDLASHVASPLVEGCDSPDEALDMALLFLSHTVVEHHLYQHMLAASNRSQSRIVEFSIRDLMLVSGVHSYSAVRRGRTGLIKKMSIEPRSPDGETQTSKKALYFVFTPGEILARRRANGLPPYPREVPTIIGPNAALAQAIEEVARSRSLSRREAQVALRCAEGLTNAEIGEKLFIDQDTVKFHLRHVFIKFGVKRRSELIARLQMPREAGGVVNLGFYKKTNL